MHRTPDELPVTFSDEAVEARSAEWGAMLVSRYTLRPGADLAPYFADQPDGLCSAEHWGLMLEGVLHVRYGDGEVETTRAGEVYHWPSGHTAWTDEGAVFVAVTPAAQERAMEHHLEGSQPTEG